MNNLQNLVPPIDLCSKIPAGKFADSALVWVTCGDMTPKFRCVDKRKYPFIPEEGATLYPAPTLQEILAELHNFHLEKFGIDNPCSIIVKRDPETFSPTFEDNSPVVAALKLYLNLSHDLSDPSDPSVLSVSPETSHD